eukprot:GEMP01035868.1.p1 GENE.GEMP01035868.1~~GEMP01035868.1.p1  ORF type:complete len:346 (+),score=95.00 GEMP01035868.1:118-1155(+)
MLGQQESKLSAMLIQQGHKLRAVWRDVNSTEESEHSFNSKENTRHEESVDSGQHKKEINSRLDARFEALYRDNEYRKLRAQRLVEEKNKMEQRVLQQQQNAVRSDQVFDQSTFERRYETELNQRKRNENLRQMQKTELEKKRQEREMEKCTFKPAVSSQSSIQKQTAAKIKQITTEYKKLVDEQKRYIDELRQLEAEEEEMEIETQLSCSEQVEQMVKANEIKVDEFLSTEEGGQVFDERVAAYCESNPGISVARAKSEARNDFVLVNEESSKQDILNEFTEKKQLSRQRWQIKRLAIVRELTKLDAAHRRIKPAASSRSQLQGFDLNLVAFLKQEPWYIVARHA